MIYKVYMSNGQPLAIEADEVRTDPNTGTQLLDKEGNIVGILPVNAFLSNYIAGKRTPLRKLLLKPYIFSQKIEISELLQRMRLNKLHMVFVVDENRKKVGIITMEDLLEELVGDIQDESDAGEGLHLT